MYTIYRFERFELDPERRELCRDGRSLPLEPRLLDVLLCLVRHRGRVVTKLELLDQVWNGREVGESSLSRAVSLLRSVLGDSPAEPRLIATVYGRGYRFLPEVDVRPRAAGSVAAGWGIAPAGGEGSAALLEQARALGRAGRGEACRQKALAAAREAKRRGDARQLARAALVHAQSTPFFLKSDLVDAGLLREAAGALPANETALRAQLEALLAGSEVTRLDPPRRAALIDGALRAARRSGDEPALLAVLNAGAKALDSPGLGDRCRTLAAEAIERARRLGDPWQQIEAHRTHLFQCIQICDPEAIDTDVAAIDRLARELAHPTWSAVAQSVRIMRATLLGRFDEVERLAEEGFATVKPGSDEQTILIESLWLLARETGSAAELARFVEPYASVYPLARAALCSLLAEMDLRGAAQELLAELVGPAGVAAPRDFAWLPTLCLLADASCRLGERPYARILHAELLPFADRLASFACFAVLGPLSLFLGGLDLLLGRFDAARAHLDRAAETSRRIGSPPLEAYAELVRSRLSRALGDGELARRQAARVCERADTMGMRALAQAAGQLRDELGIS